MYSSNIKKASSGKAADYSFQLVVPANLETLLREKNKSRLLHSYAWLCHTILQGYCDNKKLKPEEYLPLKCAVLQEMLTTRKATVVIGDLIEWGIIERNESYVVATGSTPGKSKGYRLTEEYRYTKMRVLTLHNKPMRVKLQRRAKIEEDKQRQLIVSNVTFAFLLRQLQKLKLNLPPAVRQVCSIESNLDSRTFFSSNLGSHADKELLPVVAFSGNDGEVSKLNAWLYKTMPNPLGMLNTFSSEIAWELVPHPMQQAIHSSYGVHRHILYPFPLPPLSPSYDITFSIYLDLKRLHDFYLAGTGKALWNFKVDPKTQRLFTNLCNLSRRFRKHLYLETGERLVIVDVGECQPFMFAVMLLEEAKKKWGNLLPEDVLLYVHLTSQRGFYRFIMDRCGVEASERDSFKKNIFGQIFYCSKWTFKRADNLPGKIFREHFPNVSEFLIKMKGSNSEQLPVMLMNLESQIMLHDVCLDIAQRGDEGFFIATIHDGIVTTENKAEEVKQLVGDAFRRACGLVPTVKVEPFNFTEEHFQRA